MGSRGLLLLKGAPPKHHIFNNTKGSIFSSKMATRYYHYYYYDYNNRTRNCSTTTARSSLEPPDVPRLAQTARISLTPHEVEEFAPKIRQVIDWFGQLQDVDLDSVDPALRADTETGYLREDIPETFQNRESMIAAVPSYEEPYIKVPKVLNKE
ncbi:hypothetical protein WN944_000522 [Citrus x changshan-huyou]|uniref:Glutamyl-tRNA(Gln) amidotransferase subunit C, chloroplastic/mitochondrial n=1 Tax=Citrus x changshan-huyou TaxID=2935761 RepID=A0AAP0QTY0_9ROSI